MNKELITNCIINPLIILFSVNGLILGGQITFTAQTQIAKTIDKYLEKYNR